LLKEKKTGIPKLSAAFVHAFWNLLAKRAGGGVVFIWLFASLSAVIYSPMSVYILWITRPQIGLIGLRFIFVSALLIESWPSASLFLILFPISWF